MYNKFSWTKTNKQTELPLDLSSETVENSDPIDLKVATALEPTTETTVDKLASTSKEHTPVKPNEQENEHTNGRLEEDLPEGPVDLKKRPVAIIKPTVRVVEKIGTLHGESGRSETIEVITIEDSDDEEFNFQTQHITQTVTRITAPVEIITLSSDSDTNDPIDQIEVVTISSDSETDEDTTTEELILNAVEEEERQAEDEWERAAYSEKKNKRRPAVAVRLPTPSIFSPTETQRYRNQGGRRRRSHQHSRPRPSKPLLNPNGGRRSNSLFSTRNAVCRHL